MHTRAYTLIIFSLLWALFRLYVSFPPRDPLQRSTCWCPYVFFVSGRLFVVL
jgi:hypothetical protein